MTEDVKRVARKAGGLTALAVFIAGANWASTQVTHREDTVNHGNFVTQSQRLIDSVRFMSEIRESSRQLNEISAQLREMSSRLLEICLRVQAGCR